MKIKFTLLLIALFCVISSISAQYGGTTYVNVAGGFAFPMGNFSSIDGQNEKAGYAQSGANFNIHGYYMVSNTFGIGGLFTGCMNTVNSSAYQSNFQELHPDITGWEINVQKWASGGLMLGGLFRIDISDNLLWQVRAGAGPIMIYSPEVEIIGTIDSQKQYINLFEEHKTTEFGFDIGSSLMFGLGGRKFLMVNGDYLYANATFDDFKTIEWTDPDEPPVEVTKSVTKPAHYINLSFGLGFFIE